jgi:CcmD family protein
LNSLYVVLIASALVWGGLFFYLVSMEGRVRRLESRVHLDTQGENRR